MIFSYTVLADYIGNNKLNLNDFKPHLLIMTTKQKQRLVRIVVQINTPTEKISPIKSERCWESLYKMILNGMNIFKIMRKAY